MVTGPVDQALAVQAAMELQVRRRDYPARIDAGQMTAAAAKHDIDCWFAIAAIMLDGFVQTNLTWRDLEQAALAARDRHMARAYAARAIDDGKAERQAEIRVRDLARIHRLLERQCWRAGDFDNDQPMGIAA